MCKVSNLTCMRMTAFTAYKVVRRDFTSSTSTSTFTSEHRPCERDNLGPKTRGTILVYRIGQTTIAPARSLGIFLYRKRPWGWKLSFSDIVLQVRIPAGTKLRRGLKRDQFTAYQVQVLGIADWK